MLSLMRAANDVFHGAFSLIFDAATVAVSDYIDAYAR